MNDYCLGIAYASGSIIKDNKQQYLAVKNLDKWYVDNIAGSTGYTAYESMYNIARDGRPQWVVKVYSVRSLPPLSSISNVSDFCRAYIEIHGIIDAAPCKDRKGRHLRRLRLRIYGSEELLSFINAALPAKEKKIQYIRNIVNEIYEGRTCGLYYQSQTEIDKILHWIDGSPRNESIWRRWEETKNKIPV